MWLLSLPPTCPPALASTLSRSPIGACQCPNCPCPPNLSPARPSCLLCFCTNGSTSACPRGTPVLPHRDALHARPAPFLNLQTLSLALSHKRFPSSAGPTRWQPLPDPSQAGCREEVLMLTDVTSSPEVHFLCLPTDVEMEAQRS